MARMFFSSVQSAPMDEDVKRYAETIFESATHGSRRTQQQEILRSATRASGSIAPFGEGHIDAIVGVLNSHVERCMDARFDSYEQAYRESGRVPTEQDLDSILKECQDVRREEASSAAKIIYQYVGNRGFRGGQLPNAQTMESKSTEAYDAMLLRYKQWKARIELQSNTLTVVQREKQKDAKFPVLSVAEFNLDVETFAKAASPDLPLSLLLMDVDEFKSINDRLGGGHEGGDRALMALSELLLRVTKSKGTAYRWGGDEFCVLLENHSLDEACVLAERIRHEVRELKIDGLPNGISTSIGVASYPESTDERSELFKVADAAMYKSKDAGKNRVMRAGERSPEVTPVDAKNSRHSTEEIKKQLVAFMKEGKVIQDRIAFNNTASLQEKTAWEKRVEEYLSTHLDDSYVIQFQIPNRESNEDPQGIMLGMRPAWREIVSRTWMLSDFISRLRG